MNNYMGMQGGDHSERSYEQLLGENNLYKETIAGLNEKVQKL